MSEGPYSHVETIASDFHGVFVGGMWRVDFPSRELAESFCEYTNVAYAAGRASREDDVRELVDALITSKGALAMVYAGRSLWRGHFNTLENVSVAMRDASDAIAKFQKSAEGSKVPSAESR